MFKVRNKVGFVSVFNSDNDAVVAFGNLRHQWTNYKNVVNKSRNKYSVQKKFANFVKREVVSKVESKAYKHEFRRAVDAWLATKA